MFLNQNLPNRLPFIAKIYGNAKNEAEIGIYVNSAYGSRRKNSVAFETSSSKRISW